ncbi:flagellar alpha dynein [Microcoleus sp. LEGE 07076]|uniref:flagellar alpha dynein n=1 Tax=Microcoleus sp. LEGE 07076 TaxID=915322 RepID=UPI001D137823|nr:flagellar alpha dynein [Microcoleus sp. LEGE 07076]
MQNSISYTLGNGDLVLKVQMLEQELKEAQRSREANKNVALTEADFPEPADLLNQLKGRRKKSRADLGDIDAILGLLAEGNG